MHLPVQQVTITIIQQTHVCLYVRMGIGQIGLLRDNVNNVKMDVVCVMELAIMHVPAARLHQIAHHTIKSDLQIAVFLTALTEILRYYPIYHVLLVQIHVSYARVLHLLVNNVRMHQELYIITIPINVWQPAPQDIGDIKQTIHVKYANHNVQAASITTLIHAIHVHYTMVLDISYSMDQLYVPHNVHMVSIKTSQSTHVDYVT